MTNGNRFISYMLLACVNASIAALIMLASEPAFFLLLFAFDFVAAIMLSQKNNI
jgi:hypothetical protein